MATTFRTLLNNAETTLDGSIDDSQTNITMADASDLGTDGDCPFRFTIDNEIFEATGIAGEVVTVATRGSIEGTAAATHTNGTPVYANLTAGHLTAIQEAINTLEDASGGAGLTSTHNFFIHRFVEGDWTVVESGGSSAVDMELGLAKFLADYAASSKASAGIKVYRSGAHGNTSQYDADYTKDITVEWMIARDSASSYNQCWLVHSKYDGSFAIDERPADKSFGIKLDGLNIISWLRSGSGGEDYTESDTGEDLIQGQMHTIRCKFIAGVKMEVYLDGVLIQSPTDDLPGTTLDYGSGIVISASANTSASADNELYVFRVYYSCEY